MRRLIGVLPAIALVAVSCCAVVRANMLPMTVPTFDLSAQIFARVFGEAPDRGAFLSTETVNSPAESLLGDLAFRVDLTPKTRAVSSTIPVSLPLLASRMFREASFSHPPESLGDASYMPSASSSVDQTSLTSPEPVPLLGYYHDEGGPVPTSAPSEHRFELSSYSDTDTQVSSVLPQQKSSVGVTVPVQLGHVQFAPHAEAAQAQAPQVSLNDQSLNAGTTVNVKAGKRTFGLDFSSDFEHLALNAPTYSTTALANDDVPLFVPSYADVNKRTLGTALTVPLSHRLTGSLQFNTERLLGGYGAPGLANLDANNVVYGARLTYQLPKSASAISLSAKQFHYQDNLIPTNAFVQTSANVDFTVKF